jgi:hypothetical protein
VVIHLNEDPVALLAQQARGTMPMKKRINYSRLCACCLMLVASLVVSAALQPNNANAATNAVAIEQKLSAAAKALSIDIQASRSQPTAGTGLGFEAGIQNISDAPIYLREQKVV